MRVLVTGGAGYIGSHTVRELLNARHEVLVLDNLSNGHLEAVDLRAEFFHGSTAETEKLKNILVKNDIEAVLHFAANIEVAESVVEPYTYYQNNTANTLNLLKAIVDCGIKKFIFSCKSFINSNAKS